MTITFEAEQSIANYTLLESQGTRLGCEAWRARGEDDSEVVLRIATDPEVQIILREQSERLEELTAFKVSDRFLQVLAAEPFGDPPFTVEPWVGEHRTLWTILREVSPLPYGIALGYFRQILESIEELHEAGKSHGLIRPENILVDVEGSIRISGLGWGGVATTMLRRGHLVIGNTDLEETIYFAPEQIESPQGLAPAADFHAMGVLLYEMLTGCLPEAAGEDSEIPSISSQATEADELVDKVFDAAMQEDPAVRATTFEAIRLKLNDLFEESAETGVPLEELWSSAARGGESASNAPEMLAVESGEVQMPLPELVDKEVARQDLEVAVEAFWIAKHPVTAQKFSQFLREVDSERRPEYIRLDDYCTVAADHDTIGPQRGLGRHPVNSVSFAGAKAYCEWLSEKTGHAFRLPTLAEWLLASGCPKDDSPAYPWGDEEPTTDHACFSRIWSENHQHVLCPVEAPTAGASPCGALGMAGGVQEWTDTALANYLQPDLIADDGESSQSPEGIEVPANRILIRGAGRVLENAKTMKAVAGGSWCDPADNIHPRQTRLMPENFRRVTVGFRVATSDKPEEKTVEKVKTGKK